MISAISPSDIDFEVPHYIIVHYVVSGTFAAVLNTFVAYLILFHSGRIDTFKYYLLAFQISCIISDFNVTFLMQPIGLFPICAGYSYGFMSRTFNWTSHTLMTLLTFFLSAELKVLAVCFLRKHKAIMQLGSSNTLSNWTYNCVHALLLVVLCSTSLTLYFSNVGHEEQIKVLYEYYPEFAPSFEKLREFQFYVFNDWMRVFFVFVVLGTVNTSIIVGMTVIQMYTVLQNAQKKLSVSTVAKHKLALRGLLAQFATTPVAFLPACIVALTVLIPTEYSQKISWYSLATLTTHSILNSVVVILTYPEFRKTVFFWKRKEATRKTTVILLPQ